MAAAAIVAALFPVASAQAVKSAVLSIFSRAEAMASAPTSGLIEDKAGNFDRTTYAGAVRPMAR